MREFSYLRPSNVDEAVAVAQDGGAAYLAGGWT